MLETVSSSPITPVVAADAAAVADSSDDEFGSLASLFKEESCFGDSD